MLPEKCTCNFFLTLQKSFWYGHVLFMLIHYEHFKCSMSVNTYEEVVVLVVVPDIVHSKKLWCPSLLWNVPFPLICTKCMQALNYNHHHLRLQLHVALNYNHHHHPRLRHHITFDFTMTKDHTFTAPEGGCRPFRLVTFDICAFIKHACLHIFFTHPSYY